VLKKLKAADLREDDLRRGKDELQKLVDEINGQIQDLMDAKEQELMTA
jgi:ribosome recycling factor